MTENKICRECRWNKYPICEGIIMMNGNFMNIEKLRSSFKCGQKDKVDICDLMPKKSKIELKLEELEVKIKILEEK